MILSKKIKNIILNRSLTNQLYLNSIRVKPQESCALLLGEYNNNRILINKICPVKNHSQSQYFFSITKSDILYIMKTNSLDIVAVYHSHEDHSTISDFDKRWIKKTKLVWLIGISSVCSIKDFENNLTAYINKNRKIINLQVII